MELNFIQMSEDEWREKYKPIKNHLDDNASWNGLMFETYGDEHEFVKSTILDKDYTYIWTYCHGDNNSSYISSGYHWINRLGYLITEIPFDKNEEIEIVTQEDNYMCENCEEEYYEDVDTYYETWGDIGKCPHCATPEELEEMEGMK